MNITLKIGVISGLIAGLIAGIVASFIGIPIISKLGLYYDPFALPSPPILPFTEVLANETINNLVWGVILGIIYSRVSRVIPGKSLVKGLVYGLVGYLLYNIYWVIIFLPFQLLDVVATHIIYGLSIWIPYGIILGILYKFLSDRYYIAKKEPKIITYDMKGGVLPGAFAGFLSGLGTFFTIFMFVFTGIWEIFPRHLIDLGFTLSLVGTQIMIHLIPEIYQGTIYPRVYNLVPGKGIIKGLCYGLIIIFLLVELRLAVLCIGFGIFNIALVAIVTGGIAAIIYGIVLGALYKKSD